MLMDNHLIQAARRTIWWAARRPLPPSSAPLPHQQLASGWASSGLRSSKRPLRHCVLLGAYWNASAHRRARQTCFGIYSSSSTQQARPQRSQHNPLSAIGPGSAQQQASYPFLSTVGCQAMKQGTEILLLKVSVAGNLSNAGLKVRTLCYALVFHESSCTTCKAPLKAQHTPVWHKF